jgi:dGTP triphosphohydrolase
VKSILSDRRIGAVPGTTEGAPYRSEFEVDVDRITFCDAFRRLQDKTQVHGPAGND